MGLRPVPELAEVEEISPRAGRVDEPDWIDEVVGDDATARNEFGDDRADGEQVDLKVATASRLIWITII